MSSKAERHYARQETRLRRIIDQAKAQRFGKIARKTRRRKA